MEVPCGFHAKIFASLNLIMERDMITEIIRFCGTVAMFVAMYFSIVLIFAL